jgi:hypothetical protein
MAWAVMAWAVWAVRVGLASRKGKEEEGKWRWVGPGLARELCWAVLAGEGGVSGAGWLVGCVGRFRLWPKRGFREIRV